jgi:hypothetical protein
MAGIRRSAMRPKAGKNLRGGAKKKRHKPNTEAQAAYKKKISDRRARKLKK